MPHTIIFIPILRALTLTISTSRYSLPRIHSLLPTAENFLPKIDGVTRTLSRLLHHLRLEGHQCMLLGPGGYGMEDYAGHPLVGTLGVPLVVYPGLKVSSLACGHSLAAVLDHESRLPC
jgi:hypothetical protein